MNTAPKIPASRYEVGQEIDSEDIREVIQSDSLVPVRDKDEQELHSMVALLEDGYEAKLTAVGQSSRYKIVELCYPKAD
jgi:hypothetical protein